MTDRPHRDAVASVKEETAAVAALFEALKTIAPDDEEAKAVSIESETDLFGALDHALGLITDDEVTLEGLNVVIERLETRRERIKKRIEFVRTAIGQAMEIAEQDRFERPLATLTLSARAQKVIVTDEQKLPSKFFKTSVTLDKTKLNAAVKDALAAAKETGIAPAIPPGVVLGNAPRTLTIRRA